MQKYWEGIWVNLFRVEVLQSEYNTEKAEKDKGVKYPCKGNDFNNEQKTQTR